MMFEVGHGLDDDGNDSVIIRLTPGGVLCMSADEARGFADALLDEASIVGVSTKEAMALRSHAGRPSAAARAVGKAKRRKR